MPVFELPLEELWKYQGRNPKPEDFDDYWQRALAELKTLDFKVELIPASFHSKIAECFDLYFNSVRGARIHAQYLRPAKRSKPCPTLLKFHGYGGNAGDWYEKLGFVAEGFCVTAMDVRGQGGQSTETGNIVGNTLKGHIIRGLDDVPDNLLYRHIFLDTVALVSVITQFEEVDENKLGAYGMSQGGALTLACAGLEPRIKKLAPMCPFLCDYKRVWEMDLAEEAYEELKTYFRLFDPRHEREDEIFRKLGYIDCQYLAERIQGEVLMAIGLMDQICPPSTQFSAYNKIKSPKKVILYPDFAHEYYPGFIDQMFDFFRTGWIE
ncbi:MAG TPA: alpha/beta fold hydrolase [Candidatus Hydrogenedens sp.]|nr:acetylxylan esterase [Candidatus Hydrogenedens sp.]HOK09396.1 alpha/beta fold hydrolase [Candidatus Hydrogenedens sp.]HOL19109.1 alpha/beta fold hydrolase [Candidatus Hydrogenedens sp.]HPP58073.1 alpha/beta fold hydrolase [Candidatus Hydrogenedens sp.]